MTSFVVDPGQSIRTPYRGPPSGWVMLHVSSDRPVRCAILDDQQRELIFGGPLTRLGFGTVVRPTMRWFVLVENPSDVAAAVTWRVETPL